MLTSRLAYNIVSKTTTAALHTSTNYASARARNQQWDLCPFIITDTE